eukprot:scaffold180710_cov36-Tisochrysis_lutea.AAC.1
MTQSADTLCRVASAHLEDVARHLSVGEIREKAVLAAHNGVDNVGVRDDDALGHSCEQGAMNGSDLAFRTVGSRPLVGCEHGTAARYIGMVPTHARGLEAWRGCARLWFPTCT